MKKLLTGILAMLTCFSCLAATGCDLPFFGGNKDSESGTQVEFDLEGAAEALYSNTIDTISKATADYEVLNTILYDGLYYDVAWSLSETTNVTLVAGDEGLTTVNVDELSTVDFTYVLTGTVSYGDNAATKAVDFNCTFTALVDENDLCKPVEGTAYYMYLEQKTTDKTLYVTGEMDGNFFAMTANPDEAAEVYAEVANDGYKFYVKKGETKSYITLEEYQKDGETKWRAKVLWTAEGTPFKYNPIGCWAAELEHETFFIGTYSNFNTISASNSSYMKAENMGTEQYPALLMLPEDVPEISAGEKLAKEKENLSTYLEIYENGEIALATAGKDYSDVVISWDSDNDDIAAVDGGKVTYTLPTDADATVKLTATLSIEGVDPVTKEFSVVVKKVGSAIPVANMPYLLYSTVSAGTNYFSGSLEDGRVTGTTIKTG
ncbi:MAG: hypothetical protein E7349_00935, partial [Clostridiales bacterium]|nr:hypothetical protein [Clostridiales bacterium]